MESLFLRVSELIFKVIHILHVSQEIAIWIGHWIGRFLVTAIFLAAVTAIAFELSKSFGSPLFEPSHWMYKVISLFGDQNSWVAATAIVATTVAMGHFRTLDINIEKAQAENEERRKKQREEATNA